MLAPVFKPESADADGMGSHRAWRLEHQAGAHGAGDHVAVRADVHSPRKRPATNNIDAP